MNKHSIVKFKTPETESETNLFFIVLEDRHDRVLVTELEGKTDYAIRPTFVYSKSDLVLCTNY